MKKIIGMTLAMMLSFGGYFGLQHASAEGSPSESHNQDMARQHWELMKTYSNEFHQLNQLKIDSLGYKQKMLKKHDELMDLVLKAKEDKNKEAMSKAKPIRNQMKANRDKLRTLHRQARANMTAFKDAVKSGNQAVAKSHLEAMIKTKSEMNKVLKNQVNLLDQMITIFK